MQIQEHKPDISQPSQSTQVADHESVQSSEPVTAELHTATEPHPLTPVPRYPKRENHHIVLVMKSFKI